eukprot:8535088-Pyramimonas_sp.AAC.1
MPMSTWFCTPEPSPCERSKRSNCLHLEYAAQPGDCASSNYPPWRHGHGGQKNDFQSGIASLPRKPSRGHA